MHGLIFKIKESHRQDQSESFVIYSFFFTTSQMKSLHYDQCLYDLYIYISSLFHRVETKPTHIIGINSFLFFKQLLYKHSSPNYQHMINYWKVINKMLVYVCVSWNIFNRIHFFAICDVLFVIVRFDVIYLYDYLKSCRSSFDKRFFSSYRILLSHC